MAKKFKNLFDKLTTFENLWLAWTKARRGKRYKEPAATFDWNADKKIICLQHELIEGSYMPGGYHNFYIHEPKKRLISAAPFRDRIVHHAIVNVLEPIYEARFSASSYACRKGKGTHKAIEHAHRAIRNCRYFLKGDIVKFFPSVDHEILMSVIRKKISDRRLLELLKKILDSGKGILDNEYIPAWFKGDILLTPAVRSRGLPIGNLTSQFFANVLLNELDQAVHSTIKPLVYVRYSDDFILFDNNRRKLVEALKQVDDILEVLRLKSHPRKTCVRSSNQGVKFLGFKLLSNTRRIDRNAISRFRKRMRRYKAMRQQGAVGFDTIGAAVRGWLAHVSFSNSSAMTKQVLKDVCF